MIEASLRVELVNMGINSVAITIILIASLVAQALTSAAFAGQSPPPSHIDNFVGHPRMIVISDIGNEPDDQMSLTRLLLYANELDIEALIAATSTWQKNVVHP